MTVYFQSNKFLRHETGAHPESSLRLETVMNQVSTAAIPNLMILKDPTVGAGEELLRVHPETYLNQLQAGTSCPFRSGNGVLSVE